MEKVSGIGCRVSGLRFQVSGCPRIWAAVFMFFILFGFSGPGFGQGLRYSFKQGEVLEYDLIERQGNRAPLVSGPSLVWKVRFVVESAESDRYCLTMHMLGWSNRAFSITDQTVQIMPELRTSIPRVRMLYRKFNAELNNPISFTMDSHGKILDIQGYDNIRNEILQAAEEFSGFKEILSYPGICVSFGYQKYKFLIGEFFPAISENPVDTVNIVWGSDRVTRTNLWSSRKDHRRDSTGMILLKRAYELRYGSHSPEAKTYKDTINDMIITWPSGSGYPSRITYTGYVTEYFAYDPFDTPVTADEMYGQVEVINTYKGLSKTVKVVISGSFLNLGNRALKALLPGNGISKQEVPIKVEKDGAFRLDFDLGIKAGLVDISFSPDRKNLIRIFVRPGDSVHVTGDINDTGSLVFSGSASNEQINLNQLTRDSSVKSGQNLDPVFVRFMEFENRYKDFARQVWDFFQRREKSSVILDSLLMFRDYLGNRDGYLSDSYKSFLRGLVLAYFQKVNTIQNDFFDFPAVILSDWDLYWVRAWETERMLGFSAGNNRLYLRFSELYPGTEYQRILQQLYKRNEKWQEGALMPEFKFTRQDGKTISGSKLNGKYYVLVVTSDDAVQALVKHREAANLKILREKQIPLLVWAPTQAVYDSINSLSYSKDILVVTGSHNDSHVTDYFTGCPSDLLVVDPNGRIATNSLTNLENLMTWPVSKVSEAKTINLTVFWYSFGGAFILSLLIILSIRIRSKRKEARINLKRKIAQLEVDAVRSRMNPHFLFNALGSIQNLVNRGKNQEASLYLARFGDLVRTILTQSSKPVIGLNEEIAMIRNYLLLEQLGSPFEFDILVDPAIDPVTIEVPPLLIQPHVENAVIHGISSLGEAGKIVVNFRLEDQYLICEVIDNGPGYHPGSRPEKEGLGQGWKLTRQRIQLMKEQLGEEVSVEVSNRNPEGQVSSKISGTTVTFRLPMQKSSI